MIESQLFGFVQPETGELGFVSVMGALGEYVAIAIYYWHSQIETIKPPIIIAPQPMLDPMLIARLNQANCVTNVMEVDSFMMLGTRVGGEGERPIIPFSTLVVEGQSGFIVGIDLGDSSDGLDVMWQRLPNKVAEIFLQHNICPEIIRLQSPFCYQLLKPLAEACDIKLQMVFELPMFDEAKTSLMRFR